MLDSIALTGLPLDGQTRTASLSYFEPGTAVTLPLPGEIALYVPSDRFWPYADAVLCAPDSPPGPPTHQGKEKMQNPLPRTYTHVAIQVTLEESKGRKRDKTVTFFTERNLAAWSRPAEEARWCLLWVTPYRRERKSGCVRGTQVFDEVYLQFGDVSADLDSLDQP